MSERSIDSESGEEVKARGQREETHFIHVYDQRTRSIANTYLAYLTDGDPLYIEVCVTRTTSIANTYLPYVPIIDLMVRQ